MLKRTPLFLFSLLLLVAFNHPLSARVGSALLVGTAWPAHVSLDGIESDRDRDGLAGPVRRVRTETAKLISKGDKVSEGPRQVLETATYDLKGNKIDNAYFLAASGALTGKEVYKYDAKGNITEMTLFNADGSVLSKETYQYEFDAVGNWNKMTTSVAVIENGQMHFEPSEVTYRAIAYYLEDTVAKKLQSTASANNAAPSANVPAKNAAAPAVMLPKATQVFTGTNLTLGTPGNGAPVNAGNSDALVKVDEELPPPPKTAFKAPLKPVSGGVLNGKAISLPRPEYPEMARRAHTAGQVAVEVVIDATGKVISAHAVSGPDLLRAAAEKAAAQARFTPTLLSGQPVKMVGSINYNFAF